VDVTVPASILLGARFSSMTRLQRERERHTMNNRKRRWNYALDEDNKIEVKRASELDRDSLVR
jgi:hypothetical protein